MTRFSAVLFSQAMIISTICWAYTDDKKDVYNHASETIYGIGHGVEDLLPDRCVQKLVDKYISRSMKYEHLKFEKIVSATNDWPYRQYEFLVSSPKAPEASLYGWAHVQFNKYTKRDPDSGAALGTFFICDMRDYNGSVVQDMVIRNQALEIVLELKSGRPATAFR